MNNLKEEKNKNILETLYILDSGEITLAEGSSLIHSISSIREKNIFSGKVEFIILNSVGSILKKTFKYYSKAEINNYENPIISSGDIVNIRKKNIGSTTEFIEKIIRSIFGEYALLFYD